MNLETTCKSDVNLIHHLKTYHNHFPFISASLKCPAACSLFILFSVNGALAMLTQAWSENQSVIIIKAFNSSFIKQIHHPLSSSISSFIQDFFKIHLLLYSHSIIFLTCLLKGPFQFTAVSHQPNNQTQYKPFFEPRTPLTSY